MYDIEIQWVDDKSLIVKVIYSNMSHNRIKQHLDTIADSAFFKQLKNEYNMMIVGCLRTQPDSVITNNYNSITDSNSSTDITIEKEVSYVNAKTISEFENAMNGISEK